MFAIAVIHPNKLVAMKAVGSKKEEDDKIRQQDQQVKSIRRIDATKGFIEELLLDELGDPTLFSEGYGQQFKDLIGKQIGSSNAKSDKEL
jgi:hypothetical protein